MQLIVVSEDDRARRLALKQFGDTYKGMGAKFGEDGTTAWCQIPEKYQNIAKARFLNPHIQRQIQDAAKWGIYISLVEHEDKPTDEPEGEQPCPQPNTP